MKRLPDDIRRMLVRAANAADLRCNKSRCSVEVEAQDAMRLYLESWVVPVIDEVIRWGDGQVCAVNAARIISHSQGLERGHRSGDYYQHASPPIGGGGYAGMIRKNDRLRERVLELEAQLAEATKPKEQDFGIIKAGDYVSVARWFRKEMMNSWVGAILRVVHIDEKLVIIDPVTNCNGEKIGPRNRVAYGLDTLELVKLGEAYIKALAPFILEGESDEKSGHAGA